MLYMEDYAKNLWHQINLLQHFTILTKLVELLEEDKIEIGFYFWQVVGEPAIKS